MVGVAVQPGEAHAAGSCEFESSWGAPNDALAAKVVELVNVHRAGLGLAKVTYSDTLGKAAEWKAGHMMANGYMEHDDPAPLNRTAEQRLIDCGYESPTWGENIAYGQKTAQEVFDGWIASEGHRANIEHPAFTTIGVGAVSQNGSSVYWAQVFGNDGTAGAPSPLLDVPLPPPPPPLPPVSKQPKSAPAAPATKPAARTKKRKVIKRRGRVGARRTRGISIRLGKATRVRANIKIAGRRGTRALLRCGGEVKARASLGKRRQVTLRAGKVVATTCRIVIRAPRSKVRYRVRALVG